MTLWQDLLDELELRTGQLGLSSSDTADEEAPFYQRSVIERYLYEVSVQLLLEIPPTEIESLGTKAILAMAAAASGATVAANVINSISARIDNQPAKELSPAHYFQLNTPTSSIGPKAYCFMQGKLFHSGTAADMVLLIEPTIADFQADLVSVPPQYDEERMARTLRILSSMDHMQGIVY